MSLWTRLENFLSQIGENSANVIERLFDSIQEIVRDASRKSIGFTVAMVALSAKMAKADGVVTEGEVAAFRRLFVVSPEDMKQVARLFNLAKQDVAGYDLYASRIAEIYADDQKTLIDILDCLFHIASADGVIHEAELAFLIHVADIFKIQPACFAQLKAQHISDDPESPYVILQASPNLSDADLKRHYRQLVQDSHPDRLMARGLPEEFLKIANDRLAAINGAYARIAEMRGF